MKKLALVLMSLLTTTVSFAKDVDYPHLNCWQNEDFSPIKGGKKIQITADHLQGNEYELNIYVHNVKDLNDEHFPLPVRTVTAILDNDDDEYQFNSTSDDTYFEFYGGDAEQSVLKVPNILDEKYIVACTN